MTNHGGRLQTPAHDELSERVGHGEDGRLSDPRVAQARLRIVGGECGNDLPQIESQERSENVARSIDVASKDRLCVVQFASHRRRIALQECNGIAEPPKADEVGPQGACLPNDVLHIAEPIQRHERRRETLERCDEGRVQTRRCSKRVDGLLELTEAIERRAEAVERKRLSRIRRRPRPGQFDGLVPVLRRIVVIAP